MTGIDSAAHRPADPGNSAGGRERVEELFREHAASLQRFVLAMGYGDQHWAEDIVQETFIRAWKHSGRLQEMELPALRSWLFTVARRIVIDHWRVRAARPEETDGEPLAMLPGPDDTSKALEAMALTNALATLAPNQRTALIETYMKDRTVAEAAAHIGVAPGTLKSRIYLGLHSLRLALLEHDEAA
jgi:RNA polymerase sigma-70 factor, ECF subfamily